MHGAQKFQQIGVDASFALLQGLTDGSIDNIKAMLLLDLNVRTGDLLEAFVSHRKQFNAPFFYMGCCSNQVEMDWILHTIQEHLESEILAGKVEVPGMAKVNVKMSEDLLEPFPQLPKMNKLIIGGPDKDRLYLPANIVKQWQFDSTFGGEFTEWLNTWTQKYSVVDEGQPIEDLSAKKRAHGGDEEETPSKKPRVSDQRIVEASKIKQALLLEAKLAGKDMPTLQIRAGHVIYINNKTTSKVVLQANTLLCHFGKGGFKLLKGPEDNPTEKQYPYKLLDDKELVVLNNTFQSLGKVVEDQRQTKPDCQVVYHTMKRNDENPKLFELALSHRLVFEPSVANPEVSVNNMGCKEPASTWSSEVLGIVWLVRWTQKGLMPVKPAVYLRAGATLEPGQALLCSSPEAQ